MALIANRTALFAFFTASSRVTKSFPSSMLVSISVDEKIYIYMRCFNYFLLVSCTHPLGLEPKTSEREEEVQFELELVGKNYKQL